MIPEIDPLLLYLFFLVVMGILIDWKKTEPKLILTKCVDKTEITANDGRTKYILYFYYSERKYFPVEVNKIQYDAARIGQNEILSYYITTITRMIYKPALVYPSMMDNTVES